MYLIFSKQQGCQKRGRRAAAPRPRLHHAPCCRMTGLCACTALLASAAEKTPDKYHTVDAMMCNIL